MGKHRIWVCASIALALASRVFAQPAITGGVVNATGFQSKLAPGALFLVTGSGLGPSSIVTASAPSYPASLAGTSITFTPAGGGAAINARMIYTLATQVAGMLPSSTAPGTYAVRVIYNNQTSVPQNVTVVARSFGIAAANSAGTGTAQATLQNVNGGLSLTRFTTGSMAYGGSTWTLTPAHAGDTLVFWGTGGGADGANDAGGSSGDQAAAGSFMLMVGGRQIAPSFAGTTSGYPGLWRISFTLPSDIAADCFASAQVSAGGELGNTVSIPIAAAGQTACSDPDLSPEILAKIAAGGEITVGAFGVFRVLDTDAAVTIEASSGFVGRYLASAWALNFSGPTFGPCRLYDRTYPVGGKDPASPEVRLDAGPQLPLSGPSLAGGTALARTLTPDGPVYEFLPPTGTFATGQYTLTGNGGPQVGPFNVSALFPASFTVTNWDAVTAVNRAAPLTLNWTGSGFDKVAIVISTSALVGTNEHLATLNCMVPGSPGTYSIPPEALAGLLPVTSMFGALSVQATSVPGTFTATLASGGQTDIGIFSANLGASKAVPVQ